MLKTYIQLYSTVPQSIYTIYAIGIIMKKRISVTIEEEIINKIDELLSGESKFRSRSHALEYYAKRGLREDGNG